MTHSLLIFTQWLKSNGTQVNAVLLPPIYGSKGSPTSDCYNARERHTTIVMGSNLSGVTRVGDTRAGN